jgi:hypothetical protein
MNAHRSVIGAKSHIFSYSYIINLYLIYNAHVDISLFQRLTHYNMLSLIQYYSKGRLLSNDFLLFLLIKFYFVSMTPHFSRKTSSKGHFNSI